MRSWTFFCVLSAVVAATVSFSLGLAGTPSYDQVRPVILAAGWVNKKLVLNNRGTILISGGSPSSLPDGLVLITPGHLVKFASLGDKAPESVDWHFVGFEESALNERDEVVFSATLAPCDVSDPSCGASQSRGHGVFLYSRGEIHTIALSADGAPGASGEVFYSVPSVQINNSGSLAFAADPSSNPAIYQYSEAQLRLVAKGQSIRFLGLTEAGEVIFRDGANGGRICRYSNGEISTLIAPGDPRFPPAGFSAVSAWAANPRGDVLIIAINGVWGLDLPSPGLFLLRSNAELVTIALGHEHASGFGVLLGAKTFLDRSGNVLFLSDLNGSLPRALFLFSPAGISQIAANDQQTPWGQLDVWSISSGIQSTFAVNAEPTVAFTSGIAEAGSYREGLFLNSVSGLALVAATGDPAPGSEQGLYDSFTPLISLNDAGEMFFQASLRGSRFGWGLFAAGPSRLHIANGGFELLGSRSLPAGWETSWSNFGDTGAWAYDAGGKSSFLGDHVLRLHVGSGGGARFVLSDPRDVLPDADYVVTVPVRFYFQSQDEIGFVSLIQYDRNGNEIALDEIRLTRGQSLWTWEPQILSIHTRPDTAFVRMRLGLSAPIEAYLDVDGIQ